MPGFITYVCKGLLAALCNIKIEESNLYLLLQGSSVVELFLAGSQYQDGILSFVFHMDNRCPCMSLDSTVNKNP